MCGSDSVKVRTSKTIRKSKCVRVTIQKLLREQKNNVLQFQKFKKYDERLFRNSSGLHIISKFKNLKNTYYERLFCNSSTCNSFQDKLIFINVLIT